MQTNCLSCKTELIGKFCQNCGQKENTHRYSILHFIEHDLIHGVFHIEKGILFTIKALFSKPGHAVREYVNGNRTKLFNFISLIIVIMAFSSFITGYSKIHISDLMPSSSKASMNDLEKFSTKYPKLVMLIMVPVYAIFSFISFKKAKLNFSEHLVINSYKASADLIVGLLFGILTIFCTNIPILTIAYSFVSLFSFVYSIWFFKQYFSAYNYTTKQIIFRAVMVPISFMILSFFIGIVMGYLKHIKH